MQIAGCERNGVVERDQDIDDGTEPRADDSQGGATTPRRRGRPKGSTRPGGADVFKPLIALTAIRRRRNLTQTELAERAGVHVTTVRRLELYPGKCQTTWSTLKRLADVLGVEPHVLLAAEAPKILSDEPITPATVRATVAGTFPDGREILDVVDLARLLTTSTKTIRTILKTRPEDLPRPLPRILHAHQWSRATVERWLTGDPTAAGGGRGVTRRR